MAWPISQDYNEAVQNPRINFADAELKQGTTATNAMGLPIVASGNFADVYRIDCGGKAYAVKCFTREVKNLHDRYRAISQHLQQAKLPFTVEFQFLDKGILVRGQWYPVLKMQWIEGVTLNQFVKENLDKPQRLESLIQLWRQMAQQLRDAKIAHADLQHGNVKLVPSASGDKLLLLDYDGMHIPALVKQPSGELGHPCYQHPSRLRGGLYNAEVDRFPHLVICTAIRALIVGGKPLWDRHDNGDNLLFRQSDFERPGQSNLFKDLWNSPDPTTQALAGHLILAARGPLGQEPLIDVVLGNGMVPMFTPVQEQSLMAILSPGATRRIPVPSQPAAITIGGPAAAGKSTPVPDWVQSYSGSSVAAAAITASNPTVPPSRTLRPFRPVLRRRTILVSLFLLFLAFGVFFRRFLLTPGLQEMQKPATPFVFPELTQAGEVAENSIGMRFAFISADEFLMGSPEGEGDRDDDELQHRVKFSSDFLIGTHEVTQAEYERVVGSNPSHFSSGAEAPRRPVENVSWFDAIEFCNKLSELEQLKPYYRRSGDTVTIVGGNGYRLPTEAEWEYAARDGTTTPFPWGIVLNGKEANVNGNDPYGTSTKGPYLRTTTAVGSYQPNAWGLCDTSGNVYEWCFDAYDSDFYGRESGLATDPRNDGDGSSPRVLRSGSWYYTAGLARSANRSGSRPDFTDIVVGLRLARTP